MDTLQREVLMRCPLALQWVRTGISMDRATFTAAEFAGRESGCSACRGTHAWAEADLRLA